MEEEQQVRPLRLLLCSNIVATRLASVGQRGTGLARFMSKRKGNFGELQDRADKPKENILQDELR